MMLALQCTCIPKYRSSRSAVFYSSCRLRHHPSDPGNPLEVLLAVGRGAVLLEELAAEELEEVPEAVL